MGRRMGDDAPTLFRPPSMRILASEKSPGGGKISIQED
jgi:hypothetical protein